MRGKSGRLRLRALHAMDASMRPAHYAREVQDVAGAVLHADAASMRPAHYAREVNVATAAWSAPLPLQ